MRSAFVSLVASAALASAAHAAPIGALDSTAFAYRWDFAGATTADNYDRYNTTTGAAGGDGTNEFTSTPAPAGGIVTLADASIANGFWNTSAAALAQMTATTGYTVEWRVKMTPNTTAGNNQGLTLDSTLANSSAQVTVQFVGGNSSTGQLNLTYGLSTGSPLLTTVSAADYFTVRFAATPDGTKTGGVAYTTYVNGALVADNQNASNTTLARRWFVGDIGSGTRGTTLLDYVAFTPGAYAPVPEPTAIAAALGAAAILAGRRRRR